jgi:hypothetical protein
VAGENLAVCKCVDVGSPSPIKIPVEICGKSAKKWAEKCPNCMRGGNPPMRFEDLSCSETAIRGATLLKFWRIFLPNMEFPSDWAVFHADEFGTAAPRSHGKAVMELMIQARPNGKLSMKIPPKSSL